MKRAFALPLIIPVLSFCLYSCQKEISLEKATGTLTDTLNNCNPFTIHGTYKKGRSLSPDSFYVTVQVNITKTGVYTIRTNTVNGFWFESSGQFTHTGVQLLRLKARGTILKDTLTNFDCSFDNSHCHFKINAGGNNIQGPDPLPAEPALNTWRFYDDTDSTFHSGIFDSTKTGFDITTLWNHLHLFGWPGSFSSSSHDTIFQIVLFLPAPAIDTGVYNIGSGAGADHFFAFANNDIRGNSGFNQYFCYYLATPLIDPGFVFHLTAWDAQQKILKGTFTGTCRRISNHSDFVGTTDHVSGAFCVNVNW